MVSGSFFEAAKSKPERTCDSVWLEVGARETQGRLEQLNRCLVGWWGNSLAPATELDFLRRWVNLQWLPKGRLRISALGRGLLLFEFETLWEAESLFEEEGGFRRISCVWRSGICK